MKISFYSDKMNNGQKTARFCKMRFFMANALQKWPWNGQSGNLLRPTA